jgi:hypothetical protein
MKKTELWPRKKVPVAACCRICGNFVPRPPSSPRNDEALPVNVKPFIGMTVAAKEKTGLSESNKRVSEDLL